MAAMFIEVPEGSDPITHVWGRMVPGIGPAAAAFSAAVYESSTLGLEEFEAARLRVAQINGCAFCLDWRTERDGRTVPEGFLAAVAAWRDPPEGDSASGAADGGGVLTPRARLAAEFAERYCVDHDGLDEAFWSRMRAGFTDAELVELAMSVGSWWAFGRLNHVFGLDTACVLRSAQGTSPG